MICTIQITSWQSRGTLFEDIIETEKAWKTWSGTESRPNEWPCRQRYRAFGDEKLVSWCSGQELPRLSVVCSFIAVDNFLVKSTKNTDIMRRNQNCRKHKKYGEGTINRRWYEQRWKRRKRPFYPLERTRALITPNEDSNLRTPSETSKVVYENKKLLFVLSDGKIKGMEGTGLQRVMKIKLWPLTTGIGLEKDWRSFFTQL